MSEPVENLQLSKGRQGEHQARIRVDVAPVLTVEATRHAGAGRSKRTSGAILTSPLSMFCGDIEPNLSSIPGITGLVCRSMSTVRCRQFSMAHE